MISELLQFNKQQWIEEKLHWKAPWFSLKTQFPSQSFSTECSVSFVFNTHAFTTCFSFKSTISLLRWTFVSVHFFILSSITPFNLLLQIQNYWVWRVFRIIAFKSNVVKIFKSFKKNPFKVSVFSLFCSIINSMLLSVEIENRKIHTHTHTNSMEKRNWW